LSFFAFPIGRHAHVKYPLADLPKSQHNEKTVVYWDELKRTAAQAGAFFVVRGSEIY